MALSRLPQRPADLSFTLAGVLSSGLAALDRRLPGGGWPLGEVSELVGACEDTLALLRPALATLSREPRWLMLVQPPAAVVAACEADPGLDCAHVLVLHEHPRLSPLALAERVLRGCNAAAVAIWADPLEAVALQALYESLQGQEALAFVLRPASPALADPPIGLHLRVQVQRTGAGLGIRVQGAGAEAHLPVVADNGGGSASAAPRVP